MQILFYFLGPVYLYLAVTQAGTLFTRTPAPAFSPRIGVEA